MALGTVRPARCRSPTGGWILAVVATGPDARGFLAGAKRSRVGGGRWYGPVLPRVKSAARPCGTSLRLALDPRGPPALGRGKGGQGRWPCPLHAPATSW